MLLANAPLPGEFYALGAAITWAIALVLFKQSGESVKPLPLNLFKNTVGLVLLLMTIVATGEWLSMPRDYSARQVGILIASGVVGIAIADTLLFACLNRVGVQLNLVVDTLYTPFMLLFAWLLLGERLTPIQGVGVVLIIAGLLVASRTRPPIGRSRMQIISGILFGVGAMATMAWSIALAKPTFESTPLAGAATIRLAAGTVALALFGSILPDARAIWSVFKPSAIWRRSIPGSVVGVYLSMVFWIGGFKYTAMGAAAIINQSSMIFAIILSAIVLRERLTGRKLVALLLAASGVLTATLHEQIAHWVGY